MRKFTLGLLGAAAAIAMAPVSAQAQECGEITISQMSWASAAVVTAVSSFLLEEGYGCSVTVVPTDTVPAMTSVAETGEPDILTEVWVNSAPTYPDLEAEGRITTVANVLSDGGVEGWWIPDYLAEEHPELTTMEGILANPELVGGMFHNCPEGWGCRVINDNLVQAWDLEGNDIEVFNHGSGETLATSIAAAYNDEEPWFGYYWAPTSILGRYPMVAVDIGPHVEDVHSCNTTTDCADPGQSAYPTSVVLTAVTTDLAERAPAVVDLMSNVSFTNAMMGEILAWQEANEASAEEAAVYFLTTYADVWSEWINEAAAENLSALLQ